MIKVALIDDEYYERLSLRNSVPWHELGMEISGEANNGLTAYEMILENPPDIAIIDINMPKLNGLDLIERLLKAQISCEYIILTGYDEFRYAQQAIRLNVSEYILKPINYPNLISSLTELRKKIEQQKNMHSRLCSLYTENERFQHERYYNDLVNCNFSIQNMEQYDQKLAQELFLTYSSYCVVVMEILHPVSLETLYHLQNRFSDLYDRSVFIICLDNKRRLFFILNNELLLQNPDLILQLMAITESEEISCNVGVGNPCRQLEKLFLSYNEACIALQNCNIRKEHLVYYSDVYIAPVSSIDSRQKNILRAMITGKETDRLTDFFKEIYKNFEQERLPWDIITLHTLELISILTECLASQMVASISILNTGGGILDTLNSKKNVQELLEWLTDIYITAIESINTKEDYSDITKCVETYILEHYTDSELSIAMISQELFLNYSYLCHCFKRDKQMTINDYINQVRISKALELFHNNIENIGFVAEKTGFSSASYFSKQFKKSTGLSPSEYLKSLHKSSES